MRSRKCVGKQENDWCFVGDKGALKQGSLEEKLWIKENDTMRETMRRRRSSKNIR